VPGILPRLISRESVDFALPPPRPACPKV
jgi:hypothetical protein